MDLVFDFGNARIKWFDPRNNNFGDFRHAITRIEPYRWDQLTRRKQIPPEGIIKVNGIPYAVGDVARNHIIPERPKGASRYKQTYYGVALCNALAECFQRGAKSITLFASHAPGDIDYAQHLIAAAKGKWEVESRYGELEFNIKDVHTFDEPLGGYSHYVFTEKGQERKKNPLAEVDTLVIDVGGYTVDVAAIDAGGAIDTLSLHSTRAGIINMTEGFEAQLRANNATMFQDTRNIDIRRIEKAILTGTYQFGKVAIDCSIEAQSAINSLTNDIVEIINEAGGVANFEVMLLTGGGAVLVREALESALSRAQFLMAEDNQELMKYANVFGGAKIAALLRNEGVL